MKNANFWQHYRNAWYTLRFLRILASKADTMSMQMPVAYQLVLSYFKNSRTELQNQLHIGQDRSQKPKVCTTRPSKNVPQSYGRFCSCPHNLKKSIPRPQRSLPISLSTKPHRCDWKRGMLATMDVRTNLTTCIAQEWNIKELTHSCN